MVLPPNVVAELDLDRVELVDGSFIDEEMRAYHADRLFKVPRRTGDDPVFV